MTELIMDSNRVRTFHKRNLPLAKPFGQNIVEFLIVGRDEFGALGKIVGIVSRHNVNMLSLHANAEPENGSFVLTFFADFTRIDCTIESLDKQIKELHFVREISWVKATQLIFDQFLYPVEIFGNSRAIIMRADPLLKIERQMCRKMGSAGAAIMFDEGKSYANETTSLQLDLLSRIDRDVLLLNNFDGLRALGWGKFSHRKTADGFEVSIDDVPLVSEGGKVQESHFLMGIVAGLIETLYSTSLRVTYCHCDAKRLTFKLERTTNTGT